MDQTAPHPLAAPTADADLVACSVCQKHIPPGAIRRREQYVKIERHYAWPQAATRPERPRPGPPRPAAKTPVRPQRYRSHRSGLHLETEEIPTCLDCIHRQRVAVSVVGVFVALCLAGGSLYLTEGWDNKPIAVIATLDQSPLRAMLASPTPPFTATILAQPRSSAPDAPPSVTATAPSRLDITPENAAPLDLPASPTPPPIWSTSRHRTQAAPASRPQPTATTTSLRNRGFAALTNRRFPEALGFLIESAKGGDADAAFYVGQLYDKGLGTARDVGQASYWYGMAITRGNGAALVAFNRLRMSPY